MITRPRRPGTDDDHFLLHSWKTSFRCEPYAGPFPPDVYFPSMAVTVDAILERPGVEVVMLEDDETNVLHGYIVHEPQWQRWSRKLRQLERYHVVHYVYVIQQARKHGLGRHLLKAAGVQLHSKNTAFSFATSKSRALLGTIPVFLPDAARYESHAATYRPESEHEGHARAEVPGPG